MRILFLALSIQKTGGLEKYARTLAEVISELGHELEVWSVMEKEALCAAEPLNVRYCASRNRAAASLQFRMRSLWLLKAVAAQAKRFDLIIVAHPMLAYGAYLASRIKPELRYWTCTYGTDIWSGGAARLWRGIMRGEKILTISSFAERCIAERQPAASVHIIHPPVASQYLSADGAAPRSGISPVILTVSRVNKEDTYKGQDMVIRALPAIQARLGYPVTYRVVGQGDGIPFLRGLAERYGVGSSVEFTGAVSEERLLSEYHRCDAFVMPSRMERRPNGYITGEGFGIVYIEAAACGKPVVGSQQGGAPEAFLDGVTGIAVNPSSVSEIVDAVCTLLGNKDLAARMGRAGRRFVEDNFTLEIFRNRVAVLLGDVV